MKKEHVLLGLIIAFFLVTRLFKIGSIPASLYWDEASIGYNAFAVATDLKDEWGNFLPLHFRAFGEFKLPVYIYSTIPFIKIFGLNAFAVRLPAVFYTLGIIILVYLLVKKITEKKEIALIAAFILSVCPWLFIFSRTGYEATAGTFFLLLSLYLFIYNSKKIVYFLLGTGSIILSMYSYTSFRLISPLILFIFLFRIIKINLVNNLIKKNIFTITLSIFIFFISLIPIVRLFIFDAGFGRSQSFSLIPGFQQVYDLSGNPHLQITYNRSGSVNWKENILSIGRNYLSHFSPRFLLYTGDSNPRSQIPGHGELYLIDIVLIILGVISVFYSKRLLNILPFILLLLAPIPASITKESPHALRSILMAPSFVLVSALGINLVSEKFKKYSKILLPTLIIVYLIFFENYFVSYLTTYSIKYNNEWQYEYMQIFEKYSKDFEKYKSIVISDEYAQPYIFALFYQKYSPKDFRKNVVYNPVDRWGFSTVKSFDKFIFKRIQDSDLQDNSLVFATNIDKIENVNPIDEIKNLDGTIAIWVYKK